MTEGRFYSSYIANIVLNAFLCYTATMLNGVTIYAMTKTSSLPKTLKKLLLNLALSDLGVGLLVHPLHIVRLTMELEQDNAKNTTFQRAYFITVWLFSYASFFGVISLSLDRFLAIRLHLRYQDIVTHKRVVVALISIWMIIVSALLVQLLWIPDSKVIIPAVFVTVSFLTTTVLNWRICVAIRHHTHQMQALQVQQVQPATSERANASRLRKSVFTVVIVYTVFWVCYLPFVCVMLLERSPVNEIAARYTWTLVLLNSSLNPLIYCWKMRHIRQAVVNILRSLWFRHH